MTMDQWIWTSQCSSRDFLLVLTLSQRRDISSSNSNGDKSALKEFASEMEPLRFDGDKSEAPFIKRAGKKRGAHIAKKLKTLIDEKIELSSEFLRAQLNNTSDISGKVLIFPFPANPY
jgi:hypothetical protein